jgi:hypothetical protein
MPPISLAEPTGRYLSFAEREEIALLEAQDHGVREIARQIGRDPSTISRELRRNAATRASQRGYRAGVAQWKAQQAAKRPKSAKLTTNPKLRDYVEQRLSGTVTDAEGRPVPGPNVPWVGRRHGRRQDRRWGTAWSPEQISHRLKFDFPEDESMRIGHETIYQSLYVQGRGALKRELSACLRTGRALRVPRARTQGRGKKFVTDEVKISQRPAEVAGADASARRALPDTFLGWLGLGDGVEVDGVSEPFELCDEAAGVGFVVAAGEPVRAEVAVGLVAGEHVVGGDEDGVGDGDLRPAGTAAFAEPGVLRGEVVLAVHPAD